MNMSGETENSDCPKCKKAIGRREKTIRCDGICNNSIHIECADVSIESRNVMEKSKNFYYICDHCVSYSLKAIGDKLDILTKYVSEIDKRSKNNELISNEIKCEVNVMRDLLKCERDKPKSNSGTETHGSARVANMPKTVNTIKVNTTTKLTNRLSLGKTTLSSINASKASTSKTSSPLTRSDAITITPKQRIAKNNNNAQSNAKKRNSDNAQSADNNNSTYASIVKKT